MLVQWLKWFCEAGGGEAYLTQPGWSKPHTHSNPTNLALFRYKITLYRFNQGGGSYYCRGLKWEQGAEPPPPHLPRDPRYFNHCAR